MNFLTIKDGVIIPIYKSEDGTYDPEANRTIEAMKDEGIEIISIEPACIPNS